MKELISQKGEKTRVIDTHSGSSKQAYQFVDNRTQNRFIRSSDVLQRITHRGVLIDINQLTRVECQQHIGRIARLENVPPTPIGDDNDYVYAAGDRAALILRRDVLHAAEVEQRRQALVAALAGQLNVLAVGGGFVGAPAWVGQNRNFGAETEMSAGGVTAPNVVTVVARWNAFLNNAPFHNLHPRMGVADAERLVSADGQRSIRYANHERNSPANLHHFHEENWTLNGANEVDLNQVIKRTPVK